jgi:hypothetical protein
MPLIACIAYNTPTIILELECLQLEAARIVTGLPIYSSAESLYFETGW